VQDSTRHAALLNEKRSAEARRDSVLAQLEVIRRIDDNRFVWPHLMDEISRVVPPYTWLTGLDQTSAAVIPVATDAPPKKGAKKPAKGAKAEEETESAVIPPMRFKIQGITGDIQALTRCSSTSRRSRWWKARKSRSSRSPVSTSSPTRRRPGASRSPFR
jgi:Tfp pilus assembly protein PilN